MRKESRMNRTIAVIQCEPGRPWERLLERHQGITILDGLVTRLRRVMGLRHIYLYVPDAGLRPVLVEEARRRGISILHRQLFAADAWLTLAWRCLWGGAVVRVKEDSP